MLLVGLNFARPLMQKAAKSGRRAVLLGSGLVIASALAIILLNVSVIVVVLGSLCLGALFFSPQPTPLLPEEQGGSHD